MVAFSVLASIFPNHRVESSSVWIRKVLVSSVAMQSGEMTYLPVEQSHLRVKSLVAKVRQAGRISYIDEPIDLDRKGSCVFLSHAEQ
jgi:hypothetical protein